MGSCIHTYINTNNNGADQPYISIVYRVHNVDVEWSGVGSIRYICMYIGQGFGGFLGWLGTYSIVVYSGTAVGE